MATGRLYQCIRRSRELALKRTFECIETGRLVLLGLDGVEGQFLALNLLLLHQFLLTIEIPTSINQSLKTGKGNGGRGEKKSTTASAKAGLQFPVGRIGRYLRQGKYATRMGAGAPVYLGKEEGAVTIPTPHRLPFIDFDSIIERVPLLRVAHGICLHCHCHFADIICLHIDYMYNKRYS